MMNSKHTTTQAMDARTVADARATAAVIDAEVAKGRALADVLAIHFSGGQRFWAEIARPYSTAMSAA